MGRRGQRLEPCGCEPRATRSWEKQEGRCPRVFGGSIAVSTPSFSPPGRGDCEEISVCCVKPLVCGHLYWQPQGTNSLYLE